jgi:hypothetical protein
MIFIRSWVFKKTRGYGMKSKLLPFFLLLFIVPVIWANPVDNSPICKFSELVFDAKGNWQMELVFPYANYFEALDSIIISTPSGGSAKLLIQPRRYVNYYVINSDSLSSQLCINAKGDKIKFETYNNSSFSKYRADSAVFGNYTGSNVCAPHSGDAVCRISTIYASNFYYISSKPTLGYQNNFEGIGQTLTGHIYDMNNIPVSSYTSEDVCLVLHSPLVIHTDGTYTTTIYQVTYPPDSLLVRRLSVFRKNFDYLYDVKTIDTIYIAYSSPDEVLVRDIHLKSNAYVLTGVKKDEVPENNELTVLNYPNPFNSSTNFFVKLPGSMKDRPANINIYNTAGRLVKSIQAKEGANSFWDGKDSEGNLVSSGRYYYQLRVENSILKSGSMIMLK